MDLITIAGFIALAFGLYSLVARQLAPQQFAKLGPMKEKYGHKLGYAMHFMGYTVIPIAMGAILLRNTL